METLIIKDENIIFYDLDVSPTPFDPTSLTEEEKTKLEEENAAFETNLKGYLTNLVARNICLCHQQQIIQREMFKQSIIKTDQNRAIRIQQEDIDSYICGVVIRSKDGKYSSDLPLLTVLQCRQCGNIRLFGDIRPLMRGLGDMYLTHMSAMDIPVCEELKAAMEASEKESIDDGTNSEEQPKFILQNVETGEETPADNLAEALFGPGVDPSSLSLGDVESEEDKTE